MRDRVTGVGELRVARGRARLLFVLLATLAARVYQYEVLNALVREEVIGGLERLDTLLSWLRERRPQPGELRAIQTYLELTRTTLYAQSVRDCMMDPVDAAEFSEWPWTRQVMDLEYRWARRETTDPGAAGNPACCAGTLEYDLARLGAYTRLARKGGVVATRSLARMDYHDACAPPRRWPVRMLLASVLLLAIAAVVVTFSVRRMRAWDRQALEVANEVIHRAYGTHAPPVHPEVKR